MTQASSVNAKSYEAAAPQSVAFLGLGVMGYPMAGHLARAGHRVTVYNRSSAKAQAWITEFGATTSALGMVFPHGGSVPRHPSQLYEAALEGLVLFIILFLVATRTKALHYRGLVGGLFLAGYGVSRFIIEFFREPDVQLGTFAFDLSMGQLLCLPMIVFGLWLAFTAHHRPLSS